MIIALIVLPSKFLNVYDFGMKMYTFHPITAQLFFQKKPVLGSAKARGLFAYLMNA